MYTFIFKQDKEKDFYALWDKFTREYQYSPRYLTTMLKYSIAYSRFLEQDMSFMMIKGAKPVACCFLPIEKLEGVREISIGDDYTMAPVCCDRDVEKAVFSKIEEICIAQRIGRVRFFLDPLNMEHENKYNLLRKYGYIDATSDDVILELQAEKLWNNVRKGHKYDINRVLNNSSFTTEIVEKGAHCREIFDAYVELHHLCSGMVTRKPETFQAQHDLINEDRAFLSIVREGKKIIGASYFLNFRGSVLYFSGADDPEYADIRRIPLYHAMVWKAVLHTRQNNCEYMEFSRPCGYGVQFDDYWSQKQLNIAHFKRGFRAKLVPLFRGIKYFDENLFTKDLELFKKKGLAGMMETNLKAEEISHEN